MNSHSGTNHPHLRPHHSVGYSAALVAGLMTMLTSSSASANGVTLAVELGPEYILTPRDDDLKSVGMGVAARAGYTFSSPLISFTPEAKLGFQSPGTPNSFLMMGGGRINFFKGFSPAVFAHAGGLVGDMSGFVWDAGLGLDLTIVPVFDIGIFCSYAQVGDAHFSGNRFDYTSSNWQWVQFGAQAAVHF